MISVIALSPCLDINLYVDELIYDDVNKVVLEKKWPSGKGIDIARAILGLGGEATVFGFIGGYRGLELESMLINEGIVCDFVRVNSETLTNITIHQKNKRIKTLLATHDLEVLPVDISIFLDKIRAINTNNMVIISSGYPKGINELLFYQIINMLKEKGVKVVFDADGNALEKVIDAHPYMIKPNIHEFSRLIKKQVAQVDEIVEAAMPLLEKVDLIVVSMGAKGAVAITKEKVLHAIPPAVKVRSSMGAGDHLIAGMTFLLSCGDDIENALALGVACGTAATLRQEQHPLVKKEVEEIKKNVIIKKF